MERNEKVLVINCGTSSIKFSVFKKLDLELSMCGEIAEIFSNDCSFIDENGTKSKLHPKIESYEKGIEIVLSEIEKKGIFIEDIKIVGHRMVHGADLFLGPIKIDHDVLLKLMEISELAPLHNPPAIEAIKTIKVKLTKAVDQYAVFDTTFHAKKKLEASHYAIPFELSEKYLIKRYGFHGISHHHMWRVYLKYSPFHGKKRKVITLHLGSGSSLTAIEEGIALDTTMGFTPLEGLMMGKRSGSIDPSLVAFLCEKEKKSPQEIIKTLNEKSGLLGVSKCSSDMKTLLMIQNENTQAKLAIDMYIYQIVKAIGSLTAVLQGLDVLIFSGGIGENSSFIRQEILKHFEWLNVKLDLEKNEAHHLNAFYKINDSKSQVEVLVIKANENFEIAEEILKMNPGNNQI